jgi:hypothetical protein
MCCNQKAPCMHTHARDYRALKVRGTLEPVLIAKDGLKLIEGLYYALVIERGAARETRDRAIIEGGRSGFKHAARKSHITNSFESGRRNVHADGPHDLVRAGASHLVIVERHEEVLEKVRVPDCIIISKAHELPVRLFDA